MQGEEEEWGWIGELIRALPEGDDGGRVLTAIGHLLAERGFTGRAYRVSERVARYEFGRDRGWQPVAEGEADVRRVAVDSGRRRRVVAVGAGEEVAFEGGLLVLEGKGGGAAVALRAAEAVAHLFRRLDDLDELRRRSGQLRQAQVLAMIGQMAAGTIHEINNALTVIMGQSELTLLEETEPSVREGVEMVNKAAFNAQGMVSRMLKLTHGVEAPKALFEVNGVVCECLDMVRRQFEREQIYLEECLEDGLSPAYGVAEQIQQIILNLVHNSRDAILAVKEGGRITVRTGRRGDSVFVEVEDDGPGVPAAMRERVLEPFYTTKEKGKGTGLGLSVCQRIAHEHGASLRAEAGEAGARFVLQFA